MSYTRDKKMNCFVVFVILFVIFQQNIADDTVTGNDKDYDAYDDNSAEGFNLDPDLDFETDLNTIGNSDDTRQIVMNPRERRQRRRKQQGKLFVILECALEMFNGKILI